MDHDKREVDFMNLDNLLLETCRKLYSDDLDLSSDLCVKNNIENSNVSSSYVLRDVNAGRVKDVEQTSMVQRSISLPNRVFDDGIIDEFSGTNNLMFSEFFQKYDNKVEYLPVINNLNNSVVSSEIYDQTKCLELNDHNVEPFQ